MRDDLKDLVTSVGEDFKAVRKLFVKLLLKAYLLCGT